MNRHFRNTTSALRTIAILGVIGGACLTRPVQTWDPTLTTTVTISVPNRAVDKLDLLFMIDNSASMGDKQALLAQAVPDMIRRLVNPNCIDPMGKVLMPSDASGRCTVGKPEFPAVHDMHIGIVTSSLGGRGGSACPADAMNLANPNLSAHNDDQAHLVARGGEMEIPVPKAGAPLNFLAWYPVAANQSNPSATAPPVPAETSVGAVGMAETLIGDFASMVEGVHEHGCGFEAQNEAWYRFLVQPDPFHSIAITGNRANLVDVDSTILQQRKAFLRPDSLLTVIVVTDENEEVVNPVSIGGEGYLYESAPFPSSPTYGAPEGTIECAAAPGPMSGPNDPNCTSCAFQSVQSASNFSARCPKDPPNGTMGFLDVGNDDVNVRFFHQKERFGVFAGYPISRYVRGLESASVPDRLHEVDGNGNYVGDQDKYANCVNPVFAQDLPTDPKADLCHLTRGPRTPDLVYYAAIGGVPHQLLQAQAGKDPECPPGTSQLDCPQKTQLADADWLAITGKDPEHYDFTGIDPHMLESEEPRSGLPCGPSSNDNCDPINGREWITNKKDLQFACIFHRVDSTTGTEQPKDCADPRFKDACDCVPGNTQNTPLCQKNAGVYGSMQLFGKAYPSIREMAIARAMATSPNGVQGIVSSLCPIHTSYAGGPTDPLYGYRPAANAIVDRLKNALIAQCLPRPVRKNKATGEVPCLVLVTLPKPSAESQCSSISGLSIPAADILSRFRADQEGAWQRSGGAASNLPDPTTLPVCELQQLTLANSPMGTFGPDGTCAGSTIPGWCYVESQSPQACPQQLLFTGGEPPPAATLTLQCIEQANGVVGGIH